ncbi:YhgE/Pip family protein [Latilactobacillus sakei]|uniref:YhgE/Pip family protein n=1 Tax=Latilactobacillus sakei TaxID=1599 RepID=UPI003D7C2934
MIQNEFKFIAKNKIIMISLIAIMFIPFLYSVFFLKSVWDPYGSTGELPVAVVNNDQPATYNGETLSAGKDMVKELKKNDQLGWRFVSAKKAKQGLKDKEYYTVVTLPKNFSANAATVLDKNPKKMQIQYETNDSLNFIGEVISEMGAKELNAQVRETVTKAYAQVMFKQVKTAGKGFSTAASGAKKLTDGSVTLSDGLNTYTAGVDQVNDGVMTMKTSVTPLSDGIQKLAAGSGALNTGLQTLNSKTGALASGASQLDSGANQLNTGLQTLNSKTGALASGASQLNNGAGQLNTGLQTLNSKTGDLSGGVKQLNTGLQTLNSSSSQLVSGVGQLNGGTDKLIDGSQKLNAALTDASNQISDQLENGQPDIEKLQAGMTALDSGIQQLNSGIHDSAMDTVTNQVTTDLKGIGANTASTVNSLKQINAKLYDKNSSASAASQVANTGAQLGAIQAVIADPAMQATLTANPALKAKLLTALQSAGTSVKATGAQLTSSGADVTAIGANAADNKQHLESIQAQMATLMGRLQRLKDGLNTLSTKSPEAKEGVNTAIDKLTKGLITVNTGLTRTGNTPETMGAIQATSTINAGLRQMKLGLVGTPSQMGLIPGLNAYTAGVSEASNGTNELNSKVPQLTSGVGQLATGSKALYAGTKQLNGQVPQLTSGVGQLAAGSKQLATGTGQLNSQVPQLTSGVSQLATGSETLNGGLGQLNAKIPTLTSGVGQLADGTSQLAANSAKLNDGAGQLTDGNKTLATALKGGAKQVNDIQLTNKTADMFAAPAELKHSNYSYVPNYGHALAPYVLSLALFVGAIVFNFAFPIRKVSMTGQSATAWYLSKISVGALVAVGMAIIEPGLMMIAGLNVDHPAQFFLVSIMFSLTSMAIIMFLSMTFDNPGRFLAMVLLMLQLGGSGGTFPMEITNHFYNVIHPFLPMTYSILGFRQAITSGLGNGQVLQTVFTLLLFMVVALILLWFGMNHLQKIGNGGRSVLDDNQKLQDLEK